MAKFFIGAESVIVFRASPAKKANVVRHMQKLTQGSVTLAVGDGANDINMIQ